MSAQIYHEKDASLEPLDGKNILFVGYGNQGRAQCLNLRDTVSQHNLKSPPTISATSLSDKYFAQAEADGVSITTDIAAAVKSADIVFLLIPDEVQPPVFNAHIAPNLKPDSCIVLASGYNHFFRKLDVPPTADVVMVAPRMVGSSVRSLFEKNRGFPCFVSSEQNGTGNADALSLAISLGIGALRSGAIKSSCREEALIDLFAEQALFPAIITIFQEAYSTLKSLGASDEALCYELFLSKEPAEIFEKMADDGFIEQLRQHSTVSQYGQLKGALEYPPAIVKGLQQEFRRVAEQRILNGDFEHEFDRVEGSGGGVQRELESLYSRAKLSELAQGEARVRSRMET